MKIERLKDNWNQLATKDPLWAILTEDSMKNNQWDEKEFFKRGEGQINGLLHIIKKLNVTLVFGKALDFGCGVGRLTQPLAKRFDQVVGVDIADTMIDKAKKYNQYGDKCQYQTNMVDNLEIFEGGTFDFVYTLNTLQHINPVYSKKYIKEFIRILKPNGLIVFQLPDKPPPLLDFLIKYASPILDLYRKWKYPKNMVMEVYGIDQKELATLLDENGAKIIHTKKLADLKEGWANYYYFIQKK